MPEPTDATDANLAALPVAPPPRPPLVPERSDFLDDDAPAADKVAAYLTRALEASGGAADQAAAALVPWICDALLSNHSVKAYGRDFLDFVRHMQAQGVAPLEVTADHVKVYKRALHEAGLTTATIARRLSVLRGAYRQLAAKGLVSWETAQDIAAVKAAGVQKNSTPSLTQKQAVALLEAIPTDTLQGLRDLAMMSVFFLTGCRVSAVTSACVGHLETDGVEHYLHVTEKRNKKRRKILLDAARPVLAYVARAGIGEDREGPLFRPLSQGPRCDTAMVWCPQSRRRRLNMANGQSGFPRNLGDPANSSASSRLERPGYQLRASAVHSSAGERRERVDAEVPPNEGDEVRRDGRQEVVAP
jgi:site-specific recombinase XerC